MEKVILVNEQDQAIGLEEKIKAHELALLHRAFSVFVYRVKNGVTEILLQQRHPDKYHCGGLWTNTCCSHPLATDQEMEQEQEMGVRRAAQRRLEHELGVPAAQASTDNIQFVTRILYEAGSSDQWGEHELDYILMLRQQEGEPLSVAANPDEVQATEWVSRNHLNDFLRDLESRNVGITPWFKLCTKVSPYYSLARINLLNYRSCYHFGGTTFLD